MTKQQAYEFLTNINIAVLATVSDDKPLASTMYFVVDADLDIYFITESETQKYKNVQKNPNVSLVVTNRESVQTMQIIGHAENIEDPAKKTEIIQQMSEANAQKKWLHWPPPISQVEAGDMVVIKVTPTWMRYADYMQEDTSKIFSEIA